MKHSLSLFILFFCPYSIAMDDDDDTATTLVIAAWATTQKKQLSSEWAEFIVKKNQHGDCSVKYKNLPKGIIMPLYCGPSDMATVPWPKDRAPLVTLITNEDKITLTVEKKPWYRHPAFTHTLIAVSAMLVSYAAC